MKKPDTSRLDMDALKEVLLLANIPSYLYRHFRSNRSVQSLAQSSTAGDLIRVFKLEAKKKKKSLDDVVICYALLIALTYKEYAKVKSFVTRVDQYDLQWLAELQSMYLSSVRISQHKTLNAAHKATLRPEYVFAGSNKASSQDVKPQMTVREL